jgi:hypothetical protein
MIVAMRMPAMIGIGFLNLAARMNARSWVLSPISARATTPVETRRDSIKAPRLDQRQMTTTHLQPYGGIMVKGLARLWAAYAMTVWSSVLT